MDYKTIERKLTPQEYYNLHYKEDSFTKDATNEYLNRDLINSFREQTLRERGELSQMKLNLKSLFELVENIPEIEQSIWEWGDYIRKWENRKNLYKLKENVFTWI